MDFSEYAEHRPKKYILDFIKLKHSYGIRMPKNDLKTFR